MKANELRISNLLSVNWKNDQVIVTGEIINEVENYEHEYQPIPLTEEWLEKFGFTTKNKVDFESNCGIIDLEATDAGYLFDSRIVIKHVHQLQNLYLALTGDEL